MKKPKIKAPEIPETKKVRCCDCVFCGEIEQGLNWCVNVYSQRPSRDEKVCIYYKSK